MPPIACGYNNFGTLVYQYWGFKISQYVALILTIIQA